MQNQNHSIFQKIPFSFCLQKERSHEKGMEKYSQLELQTNEQSDNSIELQRKQNSIKNKKEKKLIDNFGEEIQYYKQAIRTAQNLIKTYQNETINLRKENTQLTQKVMELHTKLDSVQKLLIKLFQFDRSHPNTPKQQSFQTSIKKYTNQDSPNPNSSIQNLHINQLNHSLLSQQPEQCCQLSFKLNRILQQQYRYQQQIYELNKKIKYLEKFSYQQPQKFKLKTTVYEPFCISNLKEQKQSNLKLGHQINQLYGNQKTIKAIKTKQTDFKKNLQKQFEMFLQSKRTSTKNKNKNSTNSAHTMNTILQKQSTILTTSNSRSQLSSNEKSRRRAVSMSKKCHC